MENNHNYCVIMAGGIGSRFWPISRESRPKQFLDLSSSGKSFLRLAFERVAEIIPVENILVVSNINYEQQVMEHLPELLPENLLLEPYSRNTAPCLTYAAYTLLKRDPQAVMIAIPADHVIGDREIYLNTLLDALQHAADNRVIITLGIVPTRPDSNFGYVQIVGGRDAHEDGKPVKAKTFTEKPDSALAEVFIKSGEFLWNSGIFVCRASVLKEELERCCPEITNLWTGWEDVLDTTRERFFLESVYADCPKVSIDYAVMEKTDIVWIYPAKFRWADIGNWESLYEYLAQHDEDGNAVRLIGKGILKDNSNDIIYAGVGRNSVKKKLVAIRGLENFIVIDTDDVLMICPRDDKKLKDIISELAMPEYEEYR